MQVKFRGGPKCGEITDMEEPLSDVLLVQTIPPMTLAETNDPFNVSLPEPYEYRLRMPASGNYEYWPLGRHPRG